MGNCPAETPTIAASGLVYSRTGTKNQSMKEPVYWENREEGKSCTDSRAKQKGLEKREGRRIHGGKVSQVVVKEKK